MTEAAVSPEPQPWLRKCEQHLADARRVLGRDGVPAESAAILVQFAAENLVGAATVAGGRQPTLLPRLGPQIDALPSTLPLRARFDNLRKHDGNEWRYGYPDGGDVVAAPLRADEVEAWIVEIELLAGDFAQATDGRASAGRKPG